MDSSLAQKSNKSTRIYGSRAFTRMEIRLVSSYLNIRQLNNNLYFIGTSKRENAVRSLSHQKLHRSCLCAWKMRQASDVEWEYDVEYVTEFLEPHSTSPLFQARRAQSVQTFGAHSGSFFWILYTLWRKLLPVFSFFSRTRDSLSSLISQWSVKILHNWSLYHLPPKREI